MMLSDRPTLSSINADVLYAIAREVSEPHGALVFTHHITGLHFYV